MNDLTNEELLKLWGEYKNQGRTKAQLARDVGMTLGAVKSRIYRTKKKLGVNFETKAGNQDVEDGNYRWVKYIEPDIRTLDDLIRACNIDLDEWEIYKHNVNKWAVGAKAEQKELSFNDGRISGEISSPGLVVAPLFKVEAWMVRKNPKPIKPVIHPVHISINIPVSKPSKSNNGVYKELLLPDAQIGFRKDRYSGELDPFHDRSALDVALQIAENNCFDGITFMGDWLDWTEWTDRFVREPEFFNTTQPALYEGAWWLSQFRRALPSATAHMLDSNHENRLKNTLMSHLVAGYELKPGLGTYIYPVLSVPFLLSLEELEIEWIDGYPDARLWLTDDLPIEHGSVARNNPGDTAKYIIKESTTNVAFAHIHRIEKATRTIYHNKGRRVIQAVSFGCLCRLDGVVPGHTKKQDWQQGIGVITYTEDGSYCRMEDIPIQDGKILYNGEVYLARNREEEIRSIIHKN